MSTGTNDREKGAKKVSSRNALKLTVAAGGAAAAAMGLQAAQTTSAQTGRPVREVYKGTWQENFAFSPLIKAEGGKTLYLAGVGIPHDAAGKVLDFEGQVRATYEAMRTELARAGGTLDDIVTMTVFINDVRLGDRFVEIRKEVFKECFPGSALITVTGFARPGVMVEVQGIAVIGGK